MSKTTTCSAALLFSLLGVAALCTMPSDSTAADATEDQIDRLVAQKVKPDGPGCAVLVVDNGRIVFKRAYGIADMDSGRPLTPGSAFNIESVSKQFTAACIALLAERGQVSLDDDIRTYLPEMPQYDWPVRIRHLIYHTSGIRDFEILSFLKGLPVDEPRPAPVLLDLIARQKQLNFRPGDLRRYSNSGYFLLGLIVERITGMSIGRYAEKEIFAPLGMTHTAYHYDPARTAGDLAVGHISDGAGHYRTRPVVLDADDFGYGGIYTTVEDLYLWDQNLYTSRIGTSGFNAVLLTQGTTNSGEKLGYAFGLHIGDHMGLTTVSHGGGSLAYNAFLLRFPERKFSVICLANHQFNTGALCYEIADLYLELPRKKAEPTPHTASASRAVADVDPAVYAGYAGKYSGDDGAILTVSVDDKRLFIQPPGAGPLELLPESATEYFLKGTDIEVSFCPDENGIASKLVWHQGGFHIPATRIDDRPLTPEQLAEYEGEYYSDELDVTYGVYVNQDRLCLRAPRVPDVLQRNFRDPDGENALRPGAPDQFTRSYGALAFSRDDSGKITGFSIRGGPDLSDVRFTRR